MQDGCALDGGVAKVKGREGLVIKGGVDSIYGATCEAS